MTLNGVIMAVILSYFSGIGSFRGTLRKSSRSLSHLLMSSCLSPVVNVRNRKQRRVVAKPAATSGALQMQDRSRQLRPVASEYVCDWLRDATGLDCGLWRPVLYLQRACVRVISIYSLHPTHSLIFLANVNSCSRSLYAIVHSSVCRLSVCGLSVCRLSSAVCNVRAPYLGGSNFRQYLYGIRYLCHALTPTENFTEIVYELSIGTKIGDHE